MRKSSFRAALPNGEFTSSETEYISAWRELADYLESQFPGLVLIGFDPSFAFKWKNIPIVLPRGFVVALVERLQTGKVTPLVLEKVPQALNKDFWDLFPKMGLPSSEYKIVPKDPIRDHPAYGM